MKFFSTIVISTLSLSVLAVPLNLAVAKRGVDPNLVPPFGIVAGTSPDGNGNCVGVNGVLIPCSCPPPEGEFLQVRHLFYSQFLFLLANRLL
jgi:hypothetical protein